MNHYHYTIAIDPGKHTGIAVWNTITNKFEIIDTMLIHNAMSVVSSLKDNCFVRVEDARLRKWFGKNSGTHALQGAGSIKRDSTIWEDFLTDYKIPFEMLNPKNSTTKVTADYFKNLTKYNSRTSEHSRDAGMNCFQFKKMKL